MAPIEIKVYYPLLYPQNNVNDSLNKIRLTVKVKIHLLFPTHFCLTDARRAIFKKTVVTRV